MTKQQIQYVLTLAEERNFSKAAKKLYVTQPSLSQFIKNIESQIGIPLFDRSTSPIQLTQAGKAYVETAKRIQQAEIELENQLADLSDLKTGEFTLGTSTFRASCMLPVSIATFQKKHPGIHLSIVSEHIDTLKNMLMDGAIDLCIETDTFDPSVFHSEVLYDETYYLAVSKNHPFNNDKKDQQLNGKDIMEDSDRIYEVEGIDLKECGNLPFTILKPGRSIYNISLEIFHSFDMEPNTILYAHHIETAFHWTLYGIAFTLIPDTLIRFGNYLDHPTYYKIQSPKAERKIVVASKRNRYLSRASKEYIYLLKQLIGQGTWKHG